MDLQQQIVEGVARGEANEARARCLIQGDVEKVGA